MFGSIVVGTDGSETAREAVRQAADLAKRLNATLHLVSAYRPASESRLKGERKDTPEEYQYRVNPREDADEALDEASGEVAERGVSAEVHAWEGEPADALIDLAAQQNADLIIVGNKGMSGTKRFLLGSVPDKVSHHAPCSVMIVHTS